MYNSSYAYSQSKTANIFFSQELADKLERKGVPSFLANSELEY